MRATIRLSSRAKLELEISDVSTQAGVLGVQTVDSIVLFAPGYWRECEITTKTLTVEQALSEY